MYALNNKQLSYHAENAKSLNEECGVFGIFNHENASTITYFGLHTLQHRGQEGAGIVVSDESCLTGYRGEGLLSEVFKNDAILKQLKGQHAIGHVRYATCGSSGVHNVQPFLFHFYDMSIGVCHNGNLVNATTLRRELEEQGAVFHSSSDSEIILHLIRTSKQKTFEEKFTESLNKIKGGFTYLVLTKDALYGAVDPNSLRPLAIGKTKQGAYILSSETCAIDAVGGEFVRNVKAGEYVVVTKSGYRIGKYTQQTTVAISSMEYVYFARPDSNFAGVNVHAARKRSGKILARESQVPEDADMVIGVPNSSLSAASGFAEASGLPYEMGLVKNQYVARTFIQPTQELRDQGVRMKLSAVKSIVQGKSIVLVDDSIVRGTTSKRIVQLLKEAGAKAVHVRIASPEFLFPIFYGIDVSNSAELISAHKTPQEICHYIGADSLEFLSVDGLIASIGLQFDAPYKGLCVESFTGDYPAGLYDYEEKFLSQLTQRQKDYLNTHPQYFDKNGLKKEN